MKLSTFLETLKYSTIARWIIVWSTMPFSKIGCNANVICSSTALFFAAGSDVKNSSNLSTKIEYMYQLLSFNESYLRLNTLIMAFQASSEDSLSPALARGIQSLKESKLGRIKFRY
jgi:hypothetical protein